GPRVLLAVGADRQSRQDGRVPSARPRLCGWERGSAREPLGPRLAQGARWDAEQSGHVRVASADVAHDRIREALDPLEDDGAVPALLDVPDERGHLEAWIDVLADPDELTALLEKTEEFAKTVHDGVILRRRRRSRQGVDAGAATLTLVGGPCYRVSQNTLRTRSEDHGSGTHGQGGARHRRQQGNRQGRGAGARRG